MKKRILAALLALVMCLGLAGAALAEESDRIPYPVVGGNIYLTESTSDEDENQPVWMVVSCDNAVTEAVIPASIDGVPVTGIYIYAFQGCTNLECVTVPESVDSMGAYVFSECTGLKNAVFLGGLTYLDDCTFDECTSLESVTIPASITSIFSYVFEGCTSLKDIYYSGSESDWKNISIEEGNDALASATIHYSASSAPLPATPTSSTVLVNGAQTSFDAYNIGGANFFKLRDLAYVLNGTAKQFEVSWDGAANCIALTSGAAYTAVGNEMASQGGGEQTAVPTTSQILKDGKEVPLTAYNINGANYFKLRDIGEAFDFGVDWDQATQTISISTSKGYTAG